MQFSLVCPIDAIEHSRQALLKPISVTACNFWGIIGAFKSIDAAGLPFYRNNRDGDLQIFKWAPQP